jgi:hypothetical protein
MQYRGLELPLVTPGPGQLHLVTERRRQESGGKEPVDRAECRAERPGQISQHDELVQIGEYWPIYPNRGEGGVPVSVERGPVAWPHLAGHLQGRAEPA